MQTKERERERRKQCIAMQQEKENDYARVWCQKVCLCVCVIA